MAISIPISAAVVIPTIISGFMTGLGIALAVYLVSRKLLQEIKKDMPKWITEIRKSITQENTLRKALEDREKFKE